MSNNSRKQSLKKFPAFPPSQTSYPPGAHHFSMIPDADDDPFPRVYKVDRLFIEEQDFVADDTSPLSPYEMADLDEPAVPVDLPPLHPAEDPDPPAEKMGGRADLSDEAVISADMKSADKQVTLAFFKKGKTKVRRPWDGPDLAPEKGTDTKPRE